MFDLISLVQVCGYSQWWLLDSNADLNTEALLELHSQIWSAKAGLK